MEHLRPLSYEEMCQMELLQQCGPNAPPASAAPPTMLPIMVIPTTLLTPGAAAAAAAGSAQPQGGVEHYYQLQPTHILTSGNEGAAVAVAGSSAGVNGELALLQGAIEQFPHGIQLQQHPHSQPHPQPVNILCTGTLNRAQSASAAAAASPMTATAAATLPRSFQPAAFVTDVESDFEGSECGAGGATTTCMPHFRFGGCGLQTAAQHQQPHHQHQDAVVGCGSLSYMMGTLAAGGAMHAGRFAGTLARNRRPDGHTKRVSFKGDNLPPSPPPAPAVELDENGLPIPMPMPGVGAGGCSYMHFDNYMDYQVRADSGFLFSLFSLGRHISN
ncbi:GH16718 [Drosophila grimshawi]|uniref:GH16718 n=1 Tax=Drosophila grimshawi TaxID=7222 RepID=B4J3B3_DROGR|nr:GH16718 [Drosophila grimshawi]